MRLLIARKDYENKLVMNVIEILTYEVPSVPSLPYKFYWRFENGSRASKNTASGRKPYDFCEALGYKLIHEL